MGKFVETYDCVCHAIVSILAPGKGYVLQEPRKSPPRYQFNKEARCALISIFYSINPWRWMVPAWPLHLCFAHSKLHLFCQRRKRPMKTTSGLGHQHSQHCKPLGVLLWHGMSRTGAPVRFHSEFPWRPDFRCALFEENIPSGTCDVKWSGTKNNKRRRVGLGLQRKRVPCSSRIESLSAFTLRFSEVPWS